MGWLVIMTNSEVHTPLLSLPRGRARSVHHALQLCRFTDQHNQSQQTTAARFSCSPAVCREEDWSMCGMLRKGCCCWGDASFHLSDCSRWSQAVSMKHQKAKKKKKTPQCSMTYLAGEEEALAKRKGKTLYTHKLHGCGLGSWLLLINRQGTQKERSKAGEEPLTLQRNTKCRHKRRNYKKQGWVFRPILQWLCVFSFPFSFSLIAFQPVPPAPTLSSRLRTQKERGAVGTTQKHNKKGTKSSSHTKTQAGFFFPHGLQYKLR